MSKFKTKKSVIHHSDGCGNPTLKTKPRFPRKQSFQAAGLTHPRKRFELLRCPQPSYSSYVSRPHQHGLIPFRGRGSPRDKPLTYQFRIRTYWPRDTYRDTGHEQGITVDAGATNERVERTSRCADLPAKSSEKKRKEKIKKEVREDKRHRSTPTWCPGQIGSGDLATSARKSSFRQDNRI